MSRRASFCTVATGADDAVAEVAAAAPPVAGYETVAVSVSVIVLPVVEVPVLASTATVAADPDVTLTEPRNVLRAARLVNTCAVVGALAPLVVLFAPL